MHLGDYKFVQSDCIDYLGVNIDETISWNMQTDNICTKMVFIFSRYSRLKYPRAVGILRRGASPGWRMGDPFIMRGYSLT